MTDERDKLAHAMFAAGVRDAFAAADAILAAIDARIAAAKAAESAPAGSLADATGERMVDALNSATSSMLKAAGVHLEPAPAAKSEAAGAPERATMAWNPTARELWAWEAGDERGGSFVPVDYVRADVAERAAAELRRQLATERDEGARFVNRALAEQSEAAELRRQVTRDRASREELAEMRATLVKERDAALAWVAVLDGALAHAGVKVAPHLHHVDGQPLSLWCLECNRDGGYHWAPCSKLAQTMAERAAVLASNAILDNPPAAVQPINVRDFGATGDGVTDDAAAIQAAAVQAEAGKVEHAAECASRRFGVVSAGGGMIGSHMAPLPCDCDYLTRALPDLSAPGAAEVYGQATAFAGSGIGGGKAGTT